MESSIQVFKKYEQDCQCLSSFFSDNNSATKKQKLVELLSGRNSQELKLIRQTYSLLYDTDILHALSYIRTSDAFANVVYLHLSEPQNRDAEIFRNALFGWKVNLNVIIELACTRSSPELLLIKQAYHSRYGSDVRHDISQIVSGSFEEILLAVLHISPRYGVGISRSMSMCDAKILYEALESGSSVDWRAIISILTERSNEQLKAVLFSFKELYGQEFSKFLKTNKCGQYGKDLRIVIRGILYPEKFLAKQLRRAPQQSRDVLEVLTRIILTRFEVDISLISNVLAAKTGWSVGNLVRRELSVVGDKPDELAAGFLLGLLRD